MRTREHQREQDHQVRTEKEEAKHQEEQEHQVKKETSEAERNITPERKNEATNHKESMKADTIETNNRTHGTGNTPNTEDQGAQDAKKEHQDQLRENKNTRDNTTNKTTTKTHTNTKKPDATQPQKDTTEHTGNRK